jgi:hypothetical protein
MAGSPSRHQCRTTLEGSCSIPVVSSFQTPSTTKTTRPSARLFARRPRVLCYPRPASPARSSSFPSQPARSLSAQACVPGAKSTARPTFRSPERRVHRTTRRRFVAQRSISGLVRLGQWASGAPPRGLRGNPAYVVQSGGQGNGAHWRAGHDREPETLAGPEDDLFCARGPRKTELVVVRHLPKYCRTMIFV